MVSEGRDVMLQTARGNVFVRERRDITDSARGKGVVSEIRDVTDSTRGRSGET